MLVENSNGTPGAPVDGALRAAARVTGASFNYLLTTARLESRLDPTAQAANSSAGGLFQFVDQTWLATLKEAGPGLGYGRLADAITRTASGRYAVADPSARRAVFALRQDPTANAVMAGAFAGSNAARLRSRLGRDASDGELYIAHFLGASGAAKLISAASQSPSMPAASLFPLAAASNRSTFYDGDGRARTTAQVYGLLLGRYDVARAAPVALTASATPAAAAKVETTAATTAPTAIFPAAPATSAAPPSPAEVAARTIPAAAGQGDTASANAPPRPVFHSLFSTEEPRGGVSNFVRELWTTNPRVAAALTGETSPDTAAPDAPLDLFGDRARGTPAASGGRG